MTGIEAARDIIKNLRESAKECHMMGVFHDDPKCFTREETLEDYAGFLEDCIEDGVFEILSGCDTAKWVLEDLSQKIRGCLAFADSYRAKGDKKTADNLRVSHDTYLNYGCSLANGLGLGAFA